MPPATQGNSRRNSPHTMDNTHATSHLVAKGSSHSMAEGKNRSNRSNIRIPSRTSAHSTKMPP